MRYDLGRLIVETKMRWRFGLRYLRYYRRGYAGCTLRLGPIGLTWTLR